MKTDLFQSCGHCWVFQICWHIEFSTFIASSFRIWNSSTADGDCTCEIKRRLLLGRKVMTSPDSISKSWDITLPTKVHLVKAMVFPVVMCGCESWAIRKVENQRVDAFELWCWRRLLRVPWTARRSNQSVLKETSPGCSLEGLMLKLKLQYFGHLIWRADLFEKTLILGKIESGRRRRPTEDEMIGWHHWRDGHKFEQALGVGDGQESLPCCSPWGHKESDMTERLNWTELNHWNNTESLTSQFYPGHKQRVFTNSGNLLVFFLGSSGEQIGIVKEIFVVCKVSSELF